MAGANVATAHLAQQKSGVAAAKLHSTTPQMFFSLRVIQDDGFSVIMRKRVRHSVSAGEHAAVHSRQARPFCQRHSRGSISAGSA